MAKWIPDPTFYPSPRVATQAPAEKLACVARRVLGFLLLSVKF
jgi:hypothetical protein